jgi:hypothetical protein
MGIGGGRSAVMLACAAIVGSATSGTENTRDMGPTGGAPRASLPVANRSHPLQEPGLATLPLAAQGPISTVIGRSQQGYLVRGLAARNLAQDLTLRFTRAGVMIASGGASLRLALGRFGRMGTEQQSLPPAGPHVDANRVSYERGPVREWYANGPLGLEQGFDVAQRPAGHGALDFSISLTDVRSVLRVGAAAVLRLPGGASLRYVGISASDARGRSMPASLSIRHGRISIAVDDRGARYPIRVDPFVQQRSKLTPSDESGNGEFGTSVALSSDGNTVVIGGPVDNSNPGAAWVFVRSNGVWKQQGNKLVGSGSQGTVGSIGEGGAVALSSDGNTALIGGDGDNGGIGAAWVFVRSNGSWSQQGNKLVGNDVTTNANMGFSVALSSDGNTALIGGRGDNNAAGAAWVFTRSNGSWSQQGSKLTSSNSSDLGASVALSSDGNTAVIGEPGQINTTVPGAVVFVRSSGTWSPHGSELVGTGVGGSANQGSAVALSSDGNTALIGGNSDNNYTGATWVFVRSNGSWSQQGNKLVGSSNGVTSSQQGYSVSLSGDGNTALIGEINGVGGAWMFTRANGTWSQQGGLLQGSGATGNSSQGRSVALSGDGNTAMLGGPIDNGLAGAAWAFASAPAISSINPTQGPTTGGTNVTITGTNLGGATGVMFGPNSGTIITDTPTEITASSPPATAGTVDVTVTTSAGTSATSPADQFTYTTGGSSGSGGGSTQAPTVMPGAPTVSSSTGAALTGNVIPEGLTTTAYFDLGLDSSYTQPGTSGPSYTTTTPARVVGSDFSTHSVFASVSGLVPNALYHFRLVASNAAGTSYGPDQTFTTKQDPSPPAPVLGKTLNVKPVSGDVFIKLPGAAMSDRSHGGRAALAKGAGFVPLTEARQLPTGTQVDARLGTLQVTAAAATKRGKLQTGTFDGSIFGIAQDARGLTKGLTTLSILEGAFPGAPSFASCKAGKARDGSRGASAALSSKVLQALLATAHGHFRTKGRYSAATVRGTVWTMTDRCDGTLTAVRRGTVTVQDFVRHVTVTVHAGHIYLARAPGGRKR